MRCTYSKELSASVFTEVENAFITEYLSDLNGNAVKVYLYGLYLCKTGKEYSLPEICDALKLTESEIKDLLMYLEEFGLISILDKENFLIEFLPIRNAYNGKPRKYKAEKYTDFTKGLQAMLPNRMISTTEYTEYFNIMDEYGIKPEAMLMLVKYCVERKGDDIGYRYISKVAKDFGERGLTTCDKVEKELSSYILRTSEIVKILSALSLTRQPDIEDLNYLKKWTQELNFETDNIVFAASKMKKGSMAKLDAFIMELYSMKSFSKEEISAYMEDKKKIFDLTVKINKALSHYEEIIDTEVDVYTKKWINYGYDEKTLLFIATELFKQGKNDLQYFDELIEELRKKGIIDLSSVGDYFEQFKKTDEFITKLLKVTGINRHPTPWDRENVNIWKSWNFSEEMILQAGSLSAGKSSPIQYIHGILSNWKKNSIYSLKDLQGETAKTSDISSQEEYNREYERRRDLALSKAQKNLEKAMQLKGFSELYAEYNGLERDIAFATVRNNLEEVKVKEDQEKQVKTQLDAVLHVLNLEFDDLSPRYACEKCKDTGYVGSKKCDCFNKVVK